MSRSEAKAIHYVGSLSLVGPALVLLSVLLLVIRESPFYIDLSVTALTGLVLASRFKIKGLIGATTLLSLVLAYDYFIDLEKITVWEFGLSLSLEMAFFVSALASQELFDSFLKAKDLALNELQSLESKFKEVVARETTAFQSTEELREKLKHAFDLVKSKTESSEMFERLLEMARSELVLQTQLKEKFEAKMYELKLKANLLEETLEEMAHVRKQISIQEKHIAEKSQLLADAEGKIGTLGGQLEQLAERLKGLQSEKEELEKALDEALKPEAPVASKELSRAIGLYTQLRSQFDEKCETLHKARQDAFLLQEKLSSIAIAAREETFETQAELFAVFEKELAALIQSNQQLEKERGVLEDLVSILSNPKIENS